MAGGIWYSELPPMPDYIDESNIATLTVAPNPASAFITITASEPLQNAVLTVFDLQGKVCSSSIMQGNKHEIPTYVFPAGIYFVKVAAGDVVSVQKVAIQH